jgi:hypothetical protein
MHMPAHVKKAKLHPKPDLSVNVAESPTPSLPRNSR